MLDTYKGPTENLLTKKWEIDASLEKTKRLFIFDTEQEARDFILQEMKDFAETGLTRSEQEFVLLNWDKLQQDKLIKGTFKDPTLDSRNKLGRLVKKFLASKKFVPKPAYLDRLPEISLSDSQKKFIEDNLPKGTSSLEMAREIFGDPLLVSLCKEHKAVDAYVKTLSGIVVTGGRQISLLATEPYDPPKTFEGTVKRLNKYRANIDKDKLNVSQKKGIEFLTDHLNSPRFTRTINNNSEQQDRDSFESEFIRHVWDKPDLTAEEINLYINLCADYILMFKILAQIEALDQRMKDIVSDPNGEVSMRLTEAISVKTREYDQCFERHKKLIESLTGKRSSRMDKSIKDSASMLAVIQAWKNEEERVLMIKMAQAKEVEVRDEINRIETMEAFKARIFGIGFDEAVYGT